ncbi:MAG: hypothetical protein KAI64_03275 [Thermoplasmata archaeon]|nr:hypothetical protein [Thermoplasmata archaeon]
MSGKIASIIKPRFFSIVIVLSLAGVIGLYFYAICLGPMELNISEIDLEDVGLTVSTRGLIKEVWMNDALFIDLLDVEGQSSIVVYVPLSAYEPLDFKSSLVAGAEVRVEGEVKDYDGRVEIVVKTSKGLTLLSEATGIILEIEDLAKTPELFEGMNVSTEGVVTYLETFGDGGRTGTNIVLAKDGYYLNCIAYGTDLSEEISLGSIMTFNGTFEYRENRLSWFLVKG